MIYIELSGTFAVLRLSRPPANAFDETMLNRLEEAIDRLQGAETPVVLVEADGRFFSAGADIAMMAARKDDPEGPAELAAFAHRFQGLLARWRTLPQCTIAAMAGPAIGGGLEFALSCDIRVIGDDTACGLSEIRLGLLPAGGGTQLVAGIAGKAVARDLILTGRMVDGAEAVRLGLAHCSVSNDKVVDEARRIASDIARLPRNAIAAAKQCIELAASPEGYQAEIAHTKALHEAPATRALIEAFVRSRADSKMRKG